MTATSVFQRSPWALSIVLIANGLAYSFFAITLPSLGRTLGFSDGNTGLILGLAALVMTLASPLWGRLCERWGRRRIIIIAISAAAVLTIATTSIIHLRLNTLISLNSALVFLIIIRTTQALFSAGLKPAGQAYIADITISRHRVNGMGMLGAAFGIGTILGGIIAMISGKTSIISGYIVVNTLLIVATLVALKYLPESQQHSPLPQTKTSTLPYRVLWPYLLITLCGLCVFSILQHVTSLRLEDSFSLSSDSAIRTGAKIMVITMLAMILTQALLIRLKILTPISLLLTGGILGLIAMVIALLASSITVLICAMALIGIAMGCLFPGNLAQLSLNVDQHSQARVAGVNGISQGVGLALGPILGANLHQLSPYNPYLACLFLLLSIVVIVLFNRRTTPT